MTNAKPSWFVRRSLSVAFRSDAWTTKSNVKSSVAKGIGMKSRPDVLYVGVVRDMGRATVTHAGPYHSPQALPSTYGGRLDGVDVGVLVLVLVLVDVDVAVLVPVELGVDVRVCVAVLDAVRDGVAVFERDDVADRLGRGAKFGPTWSLHPDRPGRLMLVDGTKGNDLEPRSWPITLPPTPPSTPYETTERKRRGTHDWSKPKSPTQHASTAALPTSTVS